MLVVYYTWSNGNTERIAKMLAEATGADLMQIDTEKPYEGSYNEAVVGKISYKCTKTERKFWKHCALTMAGAKIILKIV